MRDARRIKRLLIRMMAVFLFTLAGCGVLVALAYWSMSRRFVAGDGHALDGIVRAPVEEPLVIQNVSVWDGRGGKLQPGRSVVVREGRIVEVGESGRVEAGNARVIDGGGRSLIPGLIDAHVHLMYDSGPDLLVRAPALVKEWVATIRGYPESAQAILRRGELKLKAGVTTMRVLGDGYYSLAYRDDLARWKVVGPRVLSAGLHVNGPNGYVTGGLGASLDAPTRSEAAIELKSLEEIEPRLREHIARGVDVIKIATTHGDLGFADARPDLPETWVREIVRVAHARGLPVTAHSYGDEGDWAAIRGGVDGIEHLVNVPHELSDEMVKEIKVRGIHVCPTLSGSSYSVLKFLRDPDLLYDDPDLVANVGADVRKQLYFALRLLKVPGVARVLMHQEDPMKRWEAWYRYTLANTAKLHRAGVKLIFGTDTPFAFGNFFHTVLNEVRGLKEVGLSNEEILRMATSDTARALGIGDRVGTIERGKLADLVLLDGDPLSDIEALGRVSLVIKEGRIVFRK